MKNSAVRSENRFAREPMLPLIWSMALPTILAQLVNLLYGIVDRIYIGHIAGIGTQALAGVGVCNTLIILISAFAQIVGGGGAPLAAFSLGKGDLGNAEKLLGTGCCLLLVFSVCLMIPIYIFMRPLLCLVGASDATLPYACSYMSVYLAGTVSVEITLGLNSFINCQGQAKTAMLSVLIGAVINIVLDPILIFGAHMGVAGAALATILSQTASCVWILHFLTSKKASLRLKKENLRIDPKTAGQMVSLGISPFVMAATESLVGFVLNSRLVIYGDIYVSALTIMQSAMQFTGVPITGFTQGASPVISYNYGHGRADRVKEGAKIILITMFTFNLAATLLMILFPSAVAGIFTSDPELISVVSHVMPLFLAGMTIFGLQRACQTMFIALNKPKISLFIALLRKVILLVPLAFILSHFFGYRGVFASEAVADATAATLCTLIFAFRFPKILQAMNTEEN